MRIEIIPRLWIVDRKPTKVSITHYDAIHRRNLESQTPSFFLQTLKEITKTILQITKNQLKDFTIIDNNIHQTSMGYVVAIAFLVRYGHFSVQQAHVQVQTKTPPFILTSVQRSCLENLKK